MRTLRIVQGTCRNYTASSASEDNSAGWLNRTCGGDLLIDGVVIGRTPSGRMLRVQYNVKYKGILKGDCVCSADERRYRVHAKEGASSRLKAANGRSSINRYGMSGRNLDTDRMER